MKKKVASGIRAIFNAPDAQEAQRLLELFVDDQQEKAPDLAAWAEKAIPEDLTIFQMPHHRRRIQTVNILHRLNGKRSRAPHLHAIATGRIVSYSGRLRLRKSAAPVIAYKFEVNKNIQLSPP